VGYHFKWQSLKLLDLLLFGDLMWISLAWYSYLWVLTSILCWNDYRSLEAIGGYVYFLFVGEVVVGIIDFSGAYHVLTNKKGT
jgi:hypothetical protein